MAGIFSVKLGEWHMVVGRAQDDAELKTTKNDKQYVVFSLNLGKDETRPSGKQTVFANCKSWVGVDYLTSIRKGDRVLALGKVESREYNGRTYTDFICEFAIAMKPTAGGGACSLDALSDAAQAMGIPVGDGSEDFQPIEADEDTLPF